MSDLQSTLTTNWSALLEKSPSSFAPPASSLDPDAPPIALAYCYAKRSWPEGLQHYHLPHTLWPEYKRKQEELRTLTAFPHFARGNTIVAFDNRCAPLLWTRKLSQRENPGWSFSPWQKMRRVILLDRPYVERMNGGDKIDLLLHEQLHVAIDSWVAPDEDLLSVGLARAFDERLIEWLLGEPLMPDWNPDRSPEAVSYFLHLDSQALLADEECDVARLLNRATGRRRPVEWWQQELG